MKKYIRYAPIALVLIVPFLVLYSRGKAQGPETNSPVAESQDQALLSASDQQPQDVIVDDNKKTRGNANNLITVLVELRDTPLAVVYAKAIGGSAAPKKAALEGARVATQSQVSVIRQKQQQVAALLAGPAIRGREIYRVQKALNGIAIEVSRDKLRVIRSLPGVKSVTPIELEYPTNSSSVPFLGTPQVWSNTLGLNATGTGIRIGVIDTGIDYQHANFGGTGVLADYQANNRTVAPDAYYPTAKVVGGRDFAGDAYTGSNAPVPDSDPMDCNGHGSHVAGTAAGYGVNADGTTYAGPLTELVSYAGLRIGPGTAPGASLYALRVFGCTGGTNLTVPAIEWAMDPNGDVDLSDHLDVINMSLGSDFGILANSSALASDNAALAGVIVVTSAGNAGDTYFISGAPGSASRVIATAASNDPGGGGPVPIARVNTPLGIAGFYSVGTAAFGNPAPALGVTGAVVQAVDASDGAGPLITDGCSPLSNAAAILGNIAFIDRGTCGFAVKTKNAQDAGAIGVIIANNASAFGNMGGVDPTITIPTVMTTQADGNTFRTNLASLNVTLFNPGDLVASFSSRGPRGGSSPGQLKPDITAPGFNITSAQSGVTPSGFSPGNLPLVLNGTSMAAPHIAGIMALLRQLHPTWTVEEMKAVAMNGALHDITTQPGGNGNRYGPARIGAGRVDPVNSAQSSVIAYNAEDAGLVSITFDSVVLGSLNQTKNVRVVNHGTSAQTFDLGIDTVVDAPGVDFSLPGGSSVTVPAGQTVEFGVQMSAIASLMDHSRDPTLSTAQSVTAPASLANLLIPRHWLTDQSGYVTLSQSGTLKLRVPIYVTPRAASSMSAPSTIVTGGAGSGSTTIPLSGTDVCTGTLGAGPTCTGTFPNDEVSLVSAFELQVASPRDTFNAPGNADLQYAGVAADASRIWFGLSTWDDWSTPTDVSFSVYIDNNLDGTYDRIIFNTNAGTLSSRFFGTTTTGQDNFIVSVFTPPNLFSNALAASTPNFVNRLSASSVDSALFNTNSMFFGATPAQLGLASTNSPFRYKIETCPGFAPLCQFFSGFHYDEAVGPYSWNGAAQGLTFSSGNGTLLQDLNGGSIPVSWNTANMTTNGSLGGLLLHHHNAPGKRAEVILLDTAPSADLALTYSAAPPNPGLGQNVTLTLAVTNNGPNAATGVVVTVDLPSGLTYVSDDGGGAYNPGLGQWTAGALANGAGATLHITATVDTTDEIESAAQITSGTPLDPNPDNNKASLTLMAPRSTDLALGMTVSNPTTLVGSPVTYTLTVTNNGDDPAYNVSVSESFTGFPALDPTSFVASEGTYNPATGIWNLASLGKGFSATLALTLNAPNMAGALTNQATVSSSTTDSNSMNNTASATTTVLSPANVTGTKTKSGGNTIGSTVTYTVVLSNSASYDQQDNSGNEFSDGLPSGLTLVSATATSGTAATSGNTVTWNGKVTAGGSVTITIIATINSGTALQTISNQGTINYDADGNGSNEANRVTDDPSVGGSSDPTSFTVLSPSDVSGTKTKSGGNAPGSAMTYTVVLSNTGAAAQLDNTGNEFTDTLPASLTLVSATATSGTASTVANTVNWNGSIPAAGSVTITINATINNNVTDATVISNQGTINYDADGNGTNEATRSTDDPGVAGSSNPTNFTVVDVNDPPDAVDDSLSSIAEDSGVRVIPFTTLKANDTAGPASESGQTLTLTGVSNPVGGTVTHDGTNVSFTPTANYNGPASFQYTITDNGTTSGSPDPKSDTATVSFTITEVNDAPTAVNDTLSNVAEDSGQRSIPFATLTGNDSKGPANESGQTLIVKTVGNPVGGTVSISGGNVLFTPTANYTGPASFDYTVEDNGTTNGAADPKTSGAATASFNITDSNDAPTAVNDTLASSAEDSAPRAIPFADLTGNDSKGPANENDQTLTIITVSNAVGGSVVLVPGFVVFTPTENYSGPASFDYTVQDNGTTNGVPEPKTSGTATVNFSITEVNDAPTAVNDTLSNVAEDSGERSIAFADLTGNDSKGPANESGQTLIVTGVSNPIGVTVSIVGATVRVTPLPNFNGPASFQYTIRDNGTTSGFGDEKFSTATVSFNVNGVADTPSVTNANTNANTQTTSGLVISRNPADGPEVTHFKITGITGGSLFKNNGTTPINNGDFITFAEGNAGLKFTPGTTNGGFLVQSSTSGSDAGVGGSTAQATISVNPLGGVIRFSAANYSVAEGAGARTITVERSGDTSQAVTVEYATSDHSATQSFIPCNSPGAGIASSRCDFTTAIGLLRFGAGETSKTFNVLISNDNYVEGPETLELTLSNPTGGAVFGAPQAAILTITDDATESATNPIDNAADFVRAQYHDILGREPDAAGLAFWTDNIEKCNDPARRPAGQTAAQCTDKQRESTAIAFFQSPEFQITGGFVYHLYKGSLTGSPNYDGGSPGRFPTFLEFMHDLSQVSDGIVVNGQISGAVVESNRNALAAAFVQRPEFVAKYGGLNNTLYVEELFNTTGIAATPAVKQALADGLTGGTETRASVLRKVVDGTVVVSEGNVQFTTTYGQAFINQENNRLFVYLEYVGYLRRNPDTAGFVFWLGKLNQFNGDPVQAEMVRSFILSPEYRSRFGQ